MRSLGVLADSGASAAAVSTRPPFLEVRDLVAMYDTKIAVAGVSLCVEAGQHLSLLGPSGCGKSTLLRCLAGLETPTEGEIVINGRVVFSSKKRIDLPAQQRQLSMVFQSYAIWPHMTVIENVGYGLSVKGMAKNDRRERAMEVLRMVRMEEYADKPATALSGGQQQRVALARAYATSPEAILLDEPLSNLDARLRLEMRTEIKRLQRQTRLTTIYVTHDQEEAMSMSDTVVVMREGKVQQSGAPLDIYNRPRNRFVADFVGEANVLKGKLLPGEDGRHALRIGNAQLAYAGAQGSHPPHQEDGELAIHAVFPELSRTMIGGENRWPASIKERTLLGQVISYVVTWPGGTLRVSTTAREVFTEGENVELYIPPERAVLLEPSDI